MMRTSIVLFAVLSLTVVLITPAARAAEASDQDYMAKVMSEAARLESENNFVDAAALMIDYLDEPCPFHEIDFVLKRIDDLIFNALHFNFNFAHETYTALEESLKQISAPHAAHHQRKQRAMARVAEIFDDDETDDLSAVDDDALFAALRSAIFEISHNIQNRHPIDDELHFRAYVIGFIIDGRPRSAEANDNWPIWRSLSRMVGRESYEVENLTHWLLGGEADAKLAARVFPIYELYYAFYYGTRGGVLDETRRVYLDHIRATVFPSI